MPQTHTTPELAAGPPSDTGVVVLVVDNDQDFLSLIRDDLDTELDNATIHTAASVQKAHVRLTDLDVDCIVCDYDMPRKTGLEFLTDIRDEYPDLPVILFTGKGSEEVASEAIQAGVTDYLQKNTSNQAEILANRISNAVEQYRVVETRKTLAQTASQLRAVVNASPDAIYLITEDGTIADVNDAAARRLNYSQEKLVGRDISTVIKSRAVSKPLPALASESDRTQFEGHHIKRRDSKFPVDVRINTIDHPDVEQYLVIAQDITSQKRYKETIEELNDTGLALMEAESRDEVADIALNAARETLTMPLTRIWFYDEEENVLEPAGQTERAADRFGGQQPYGPDSRLWDVWVDDVSRCFSGVVGENRYPDDAGVEDELVFPLREHGLLAVAATDTRLYDKKDICLAQLLKTSVKGALEQTEREERIRAEKEFFNAAVNTIEDIFFSTTADETLLRWNETLEHVTETTISDIVSPSIGDVFQDDAYRDLSAHVADAFESGSATTTIALPTPDGPRVFEFASVSMEHPQQDTQYVVTLGRDITQLKEHQAELERQNERLDKFSSLVVHDFQNPLQIAQGHFERLRDTDGEGPEESAEAVQRAHDRMQELIDDLLTLTEQGEQSPDLRETDVETIAKRSWKMIDSGNATLEIRSIDRIRADHTKLQHVFENLLGNAITHGRDDVRITVGPLEDGDGFYVEDDGDGVPAEFQEKVFDSGFTTANDGTGIGLMIVDDIASQHGWDVALTTSAPDGARFEFSNVEFVDD